MIVAASRLFREKVMSEYESISGRERSHWNSRYEESNGAQRAPDLFLVESYERVIRPAFPAGGDALDVAGGAGRHAFFLAGQGWRVTLADISEIALAQAEEEARARKLPLTVLAGDTRLLDLGRECFDLVTGFYFLDRPTFAKIATALRPGGMVIYQTFTSEHRKYEAMGPTRGDYFLQPMELRGAFNGFELLFYDEYERERGLAQLIARKPV